MAIETYPSLSRLPVAHTLFRSLSSPSSSTVLGVAACVFSAYYDYPRVLLSSGAYLVVKAGSWLKQPLYCLPKGLSQITQTQLMNKMDEFYSDLVLCGLKEENHKIARQRYNAMYRIWQQSPENQSNDLLTSKLIELEDIIRTKGAVRRSSERDTLRYSVCRLYEEMTQSSLNKDSRERFFIRLKDLVSLADGSASLEIMQKLDICYTILTANTIPSTKETLAFKCRSLVHEMAYSLPTQAKFYQKCLQLYRDFKKLETQEILLREQALDDLNRIYAALIGKESAPSTSASISISSAEPRCRTFSSSSSSSLVHRATSTPTTSSGAGFTTSAGPITASPISPQTGFVPATALFGCLGESLDTCPTISEICNSKIRTEYGDRNIIEQVLGQELDRNLNRYRDFTSSEAELLRDPHNWDEDFRDIVKNAWFNVFNSTLERLATSSENMAVMPVGYLYENGRQGHSITVLFIKENDGSFTIEFCDGWGKRIYDENRKDIITFEKLIQDWVDSKKRENKKIIRFRSLPKEGMQMHFNDPWERDQFLSHEKGCCTVFSLLYVCLRKWNVTPERIKKVMLFLGPEGRKNILRQLGKVVLNPTGENRAFFKKLITRLF